MAKIFEYDNEARQKNLAGVEKLAKAVRSTLGPRGRNVMIERPHRAPMITKDGATVAKYVYLKDPMEQMAAELVKDVASKTSDDAGDGTTTATILTHAIYKEGCKKVADGANPVDLKRGIDKAVKVVVKALEELSVPCNTTEAIAQVGTISANSDQEVGDIISRAMAAVGKDGVISVEDGSTFEDELEVVDGMKLERGYVSPYFANIQATMSCELDNPYVLLAGCKLKILRALLPILELVTKSGRSLLIICDELEGEALSALVINNQSGALRSCALYSPGIGNSGKAALQDVAILTGATVICPENNIKIESATLEHLGTVKKAVVTKSTTTLIDGSGDTTLIKDRIVKLISQAKEEKNPKVKEDLQHRAAKMSGGVAIIKVGATTDVEMVEKKARVEDALHATQAAVEEGVVPGGGTAYLRVLSKVQEIKTGVEDERLGVEIIEKALQEPLKQIVKNAGRFPDLILDSVKSFKGNVGYNAARDEYCDMLQMGIIDPTKVARSSLQNAASVAGLMLTTDCMIAEEVEDDDNK